METDRKKVQEVIDIYRADVIRLMKYIPWLETKKGTEVSSEFRGEGIADTSISFPVYDGTLMSFIKEARSTGLMNRNYVYTYSRNRLKTAADEQNYISKATIKNIHELADILSKYVLLGMTKSRVWSEGVENQIFLKVILKMKELIEFWDKPLA